MRLDSVRSQDIGRSAPLSEAEERSIVIDISDFGANHAMTLALAAAVWAYFGFLCPALSRRAGLAFEDPPLWLYGATFKALMWISLPALLYVAFLFPMENDIGFYVSELTMPLGLAVLESAVCVGALFGLIGLIRQAQLRRQEVVLEPLSGSQIFVRILLIGAVPLGALAAAAGLAVVMGVDIADLPDFLLEQSDLGTFCALVGLYALLWAIPKLRAFRLEDEGESTIGANTSGLELFRWGWLGLTVLAGAGVLSEIPGPDVVFTRPMPLAVGLILPVAGGAIYGLFWALPLRRLAAKASEGDFLAQELLPQGRFWGFPALLRYSQRARGGLKRFEAEGAEKLCPRCMRSINELALYKNFKYDACPHCGDFIPPIFTIGDYVKQQTELIMPMINENAAPGTRKRRKRGEGEGELVQDLIHALLAMAVHERGTDIHIIPQSDKLILRCRTDGVLYTMAEFEPSMAKPLISALKVLAQLDISERRKPQDGSFEVNIGDRQLDVRLNTSPVPEGEMAAARLLYSHFALGSISRLGMQARSLRTLTEIIHRPSGLVLVTGPTGSGKSTTLYNSLEAIATGERNIITLEDPIEYKIKGLTQMQINDAKGFTFATGLRSILRQDPDVIMVGEIRDTETAQMAIESAGTGHLVFSTLHATDTMTTIERLSDLGIEASRLASVLALVLTQRLVRLICDPCAVEQVITREELATLGYPNAPEQRYMIRRGMGCPRCHETGYYGREGIYELFVPNDELKRMIGGNGSLMTLRQRARQLGMRTLMEDGITKVLLGLTTIEEVSRVTT